MNYHGRIMNLQRTSSCLVSCGDEAAFERGHQLGHKEARHAAADIACEAEAEITALRALIKEAPRFFSHHDYTFTHDIACRSCVVNGFKRLYAYVHPAGRYMHFSVEKDVEVKFLCNDLKDALKEYEALP